MNTHKQASFSGGEFSPALWARADVTRYATGLKLCKNFFVKRQGGVDNRAGTSYVTTVKDSTQPIRTIDWIFNSTQSYILEFGSKYMRIHQNGAPVLVGTLAAWSTVTAYNVGDLVSNSGVNYYCIVANTNNVTTNPAFWYPLTGNIYEIPTPYVTADLPSLDYSQSADVMTLTQHNYPPMELSRFGQTDWTLAAINYGPSIATPTNFSGTNTTAGFAKNSWYVTAVDLAGQESLAAVWTSNTRVIAAFPVTLTWNSVPGAVQYKLYKGISPYSGTGTFDSGLTAADGVLGLISTQASTGFIDDATPVPDPAFQPTNSTARNPFLGVGNYPAVCLYSQQRRMFGRTDNNPETIFCSYIGAYSNFENYLINTDAETLQFTLSGRQVNEIRHLAESRQTLALTIGSEWSINGDQAGVLRSTSINAKQQTYHGASIVRPLNISNQLMYIQARGSIVRLLGFDSSGDGYDGEDLTIYSAHLFDGFTIVDWAYQQVPNSIIWCVRSDGVVMSMTYIREQQMIAWTQHDFGGIVENVTVIPEGTEDAVYFVVNRTINGATARYIERMNTRNFTDIRNAIFMDAALSYDGRSSDGSTMTLSGGTTWAYTETLTLTSSVAKFLPGDVGGQIFLTAADGTVIRFAINAYTSSTIVTGKATENVPANLQGVATSIWSKALASFSGLSHLEGQQVSVIGDAFVVASPNNIAYPIVVVAGGAITLPAPYAVVHVGLPITSDFQTLDIETPSGETLEDKKKLITAVTLYVQSSRGIWAGSDIPAGDDPLEELEEFQLRNQETMDEPTNLTTGAIDVNIPSDWTDSGSIFVRQVDPLPLSILAAIATGMIPGGQ